MTTEERETLLAASAILAKYRADADAPGIVVSLGSHAATPRDSIDHFSVALMLGGEIYSGAAKYLHDAGALARRKYEDERSRRTKAASEAKTVRPRALSPHDRMHEAVA